MAIPIDIMSADEFAKNTKLDKFQLKRALAGDKHPLKVIKSKLAELHKMTKGKLDARHALMKEIATLCLAYAGDKPDSSKKSTKTQTVLRLCVQVTNRGVLERVRGAEIAEKMKSGSGKALVGDLQWEALNVPGALGLRGDALVDLAKTKYGVDLTGDESKDWYAMKKILKAAKSDFADQMNLLYMSAEQRAKHLLTFTDAPDKGYVLMNGAPYTTLYTKEHGGKKIAGDLSEDMYAMDPADGSVYCAHQNEYHTDKQIFHHSSFLAGRKAVAAGLICVKNGRLLEISDESGHYKPEIDNLLTACELIVSTGYDVAPEGHVLIHDWAETWKPIKVAKDMDGKEEKVPAGFRVPIGEFISSNGSPKDMVDFHWIKGASTDYEYADKVKAKKRGCTPA